MAWPAAVPRDPVTPVATLDAGSLILDRARYASLRRQERQRMITIRAARRVQLGDRVALEFEDAETLLYQAQEMVYTESVTDPGAAAAELDAYRRLLPGSTSLCATFLVELDDPAAVRAELERLRGLHRAVFLRAGGAAARGEEIVGPDEDGPAEATASVHFLRFDLDAELRSAMRSGTSQVVVSIEHPEYHAEVALEDGQRRRLAADLD